MEQTTRAMNAEKGEIRIIQMMVGGWTGSLELADANYYKYIAWINNKVVLYSTGSSIQYPVINLNGKEYEKECINMYN